MINIYFKNRNVLNGLDLDKPIYKYIPLKYVLQMLKSRQMYFSKVKRWEDTYENFFLKQDFRIDGKMLSADNLAEQVYGQSWTLLAESDAMWRIYSNINKQNDVAIKVKTTARKLYDAIYTKDECMATTYIGIVQYLYKNQLNTWMRNLNLTGLQDFGNYVVESMFMKRKPFVHEMEVRPIVFLDHDEGDGIVYAFNPDDMFEQYVIDPRLDKESAKKIMIKLLKAGCDPKKVKQSTLYSFTPNVIEIIK